MTSLNVSRTLCFVRVQRYSEISAQAIGLQIVIIGNNRIPTGTGTTTTMRYPSSLLFRSSDLEQHPADAKCI